MASELRAGALVCVCSARSPVAFDTTRRVLAWYCQDGTLYLCLAKSATALRCATARKGKLPELKARPRATRRRAIFPSFVFRCAFDRMEDGRQPAARVIRSVNNNMRARCIHTYIYVKGVYRVRSPLYRDN